MSRDSNLVFLELRRAKKRDISRPVSIACVVFIVAVVSYLGAVAMGVRLWG